MRKRFLLLCSIVMSLACAADICGQPRVDRVGACLVVHVREGSTSPPSINALCSRIPQPHYSQGKTFQELYSWTPEVLAFAFDEAERGLTGRVTGVTGNKHARLILIPDGLPNAGVPSGAIQRTGTSVDIFVNSGLIDFVESTVGGYMADVLANTSERQPALGFRAWLAAMRAAGESPSSSGEPRPVPWPGPLNPPLDWNLRYIRTPAHSVYQLIFAHELSHILLNIESGGNTAQEALDREIACDRNAFRSMGAESPYVNSTTLKGNVLPTFIINFLIGMWYYENLRGTELHNIFKGIDSPPSFKDMFPARDWNQRARVIADEWQRVCENGVGAVACKPGWQEALAEARQLISSRPPRGQLGRTTSLVQDVTSFFSFIGLNYGDTMNDARQKFGQPENTRTRPTRVYLEYFGKDLEIGGDTSGRITSIDIKLAAVPLIRSHAISDTKLNFLGRNKTQILSIFGAPESSDSDNYEYRFGVPRHSGRVTFICYDFEHYVCNEIDVDWNY